MTITYTTEEINLMFIEGQKLAKRLNASEINTNLTIVKKIIFNPYWEDRYSTREEAMAYSMRTPGVDYLIIECKRKNKVWVYV